MTLSIDGGEINRSAAWYFSRLEPSGTIYAKAPNGAEFVVKRGDMNSVAGRELLQAMASALTGPHRQAAETAQDLPHRPQPTDLRYLSGMGQTLRI